MSRLLLEDDKPVYRSKSVWTGVITALLPLIPGVAQFIAEHPEIVTVVNGIVIIGLRLITKVPIR